VSADLKTASNGTEAPPKAEPAPSPTPAPSRLEITPAVKPARPWIILAAIVVVVGIAAVTTSGFVRGGRYPSTNDAYVEGRAVRISPRVAGPVIRLNVDDNSQVTAGDVLLEIDPADFQAKVDQGRASVETARASEEQAEASVLRAQAAIGEATASLSAAEAEARRRTSDLKRYTAMGTDGVSEQQLDTAQAAADVASQQREAAAKKVAASEADLNVAKATVASAHARVADTEAQLRFAELQLQYTRVIAPVSGRITKRNVESGSFVSTGQPLMAIVPIDCWIVANFKEVQLEHMRAGQPAEVRVDAYPDLRLRARVDSIQAGTGSRFQLLPPENATGNWVKVVQRVPVKLVLEAGQDGAELLALGMSVEVTVDESDPSSAPRVPAHVQLPSSLERRP
jgi:membrane fusion protein (multidrug efflux system)